MKIKIWISITLNIILVVLLATNHVHHRVADHYYKEFTGFVLSRSAAQIDAGNSKMVGDILREVQEGPTYGELLSMYEKLATEKSVETAEAKQE